MEKNRKIYNKLKDIRIELNNIKKLKEVTEERYSSVVSSCSHDYILVYDKGKILGGGEILRSYCLVCDKKIIYNSFRDYEDLENNCIIDITDKNSNIDCVELMLDSIGVSKFEKKINKAREIFSKYFSDEYKNFNEKDLRYMIKRDILKNVANKDVKIKIKRIQRNDGHE